MKNHNPYIIFHVFFITWVSITLLELYFLQILKNSQSFKAKLKRAVLYMLYNHIQDPKFIASHLKIDEHEIIKTLFDLQTDELIKRDYDKKSNQEEYELSEKAEEIAFLFQQKWEIKEVEDYTKVT